MAFTWLPALPDDVHRWQGREMRARGMLFLVVVLLLAVGCNEPPLYRMHAREFLQQQGVDADLIDRLLAVEPLDGPEADRLSRFDNLAVLHLLASNPSTPAPLVARLARHSSMDVRNGVAINPNAPLELLLSLRTPGRYTTQNNALARNPRMPQTLLREMYENQEAGWTSLAMNPNTPPDLLRKIAAEGSEVDRAWLAKNPGLTEELVLLLEKDRSRIVRNHLETNPVYQRIREGRAAASP